MCKIYVAVLQVLIVILFAVGHAHIINKDEVQGYVMSNVRPNS